MTKIVITGATSFLGHALYHYLNDKGYDVIGTARDIDKAKNMGVNHCVKLDLNAMKTAFFVAKEKPDIIIHLAALSNPTYKGSPEEFVKVNIDGTRKICEAAEGKKIVFASSIVVYGDQFECKESQTLCRPTTLYGATKAAGESIIQAYSRTHDINYSILRLCSIVGPGMTHGAVRDIERKVRRNQCEFYGAFPGSNKPFVHVDDVIGFTERVMHNKYKNEIYNVCGSGSLTILEIKKIFDPENECEITWDKTKVWKGDNRSITCNIEKMHSIYEPVFPTSRMAIESLVGQI